MSAIDRKLAEIAGRGGPDAVRLVAVLREQRDEYASLSYTNVDDMRLNLEAHDAAALAALEGE